MKAGNLLAGDVDHLAALGYKRNRGLTQQETLLSLATSVIPATLEQAGDPRALVFQHCNAESAVLPRDPDDSVGSSRNRYFPAAVLRELQLDDIPYLCSFASGCAGFLSVVITACGLFIDDEERPVICVMADDRVPGFPFDMLRERILGSDHSSSFLVGRRPHGYHLLGINFYSTTRTLVPLVEIVKRTVQMIQDLATHLALDLTARDVVIHYPNIFPDTWRMVTRYLRLARVEAVIDEIAERAHCGATDSVITLAKHHRGEEGRMHVVVNYGVGLHLGVCILEEQNGATPRN
ncbi:MAG: hypothetical protein H0X73_09680 [Chthoniobacterales bacterium]|nr:hypothetical protein [Chthoniobacterales bacterium]